MDAWRLPTKLNINGTDYNIRTDFREVLDILCALVDPDLETDEKWLAVLMILYIDFDKMPQSDYIEACKQAKEFIDMGVDKEEKKVRPRTMDWEQDAQLIIPAVNKVLSTEVRGLDYLHWWTFLSAYMEIGECTFSHILNIRTKKAKGKKLEKWEQEFIRDNPDLVNIKRRLSEEELEEEKAIEELFGNEPRQ